jgi:KaiC/GvpD/RAD55 family RecA-like ATPase
VQYPDADKTIYESLLNGLQALDISDKVGYQLLSQIKARKAALNLSERAYKVAQGVDSVESLHEFYVGAFEKDDHQPELSLKEVTQNLGELIDQCYTEQGARWRLDCLNKSLGSLRAGDFGFIFARPETGKTTFLASECTSFLHSSQQPVIWLNNEEQGNKVMLRIYQAYFGVTTDQLFSNWKRYEHEFLKQTDNRFKLFDSATIHRKDVEQIVKQLNPGIVVYDQIDKIKGFNNDREDLRLGSIYQWARELAKGSHAAIGVCQASGNAEGVRYLTMDHVANALTAKQAEADWIMGIGKTHDPTEQNIRYLNISKNKLLGDKDSIPNLRHGRFEVLLKAEIARYEDIVRYD